VLGPLFRHGTVFRHRRLAVFALYQERNIHINRVGHVSPANTLKNEKKGVFCLS
jgi:hypothetical protein